MTSLMKSYCLPDLESGDADLCEFDIDFLREMNGEDRGLAWGAAMSVSLEFLYNRGYVTRIQKMSGLKYELTEAGKKIAEMHKKP